MLDLRQTSSPVYGTTTTDSVLPLHRDDPGEFTSSSSSATSPRRGASSNISSQVRDVRSPRDTSMALRYTGLAPLGICHGVPRQEAAQARAVRLADLRPDPRDVDLPGGARRLVAARLSGHALTGVATSGSLPAVSSDTPRTPASAPGPSATRRCRPTCTCPRRTSASSTRRGCG